MLALKTIVGVMLSIDCNGRMYTRPLGQDVAALIELSDELDNRPILTTNEMEQSIRHYYHIQEELTVQESQLGLPFEQFNNEMLQTFLAESVLYDNHYTFELDENSYWFAFSLDYVPVIDNVLKMVKYDELAMVFRSIDPNMKFREDGSIDVKVGNIVANCITTQLSPNPYHYSIQFSNLYHTIQPRQNAELVIRLCLAVHSG